MLIRTSLLLLSCLSFCLEAAYLTPPQGFKEVHRENSLPSIQKNYLYSEKGIFVPSMNIGFESRVASSKEYLKKIKEHFSHKPEYTITELPKIQTKSGPAYLFQIDKNDRWGDIRMFQVIAFDSKGAYTITACALKQEFNKFEKDFLTAFESFSFHEN